MRDLKRDPYARATFQSKVATSGTPACACVWCGQETCRLYRYRWQADSGPTARWSSAFCSVSCYRSYAE